MHPLIPRSSRSWKHVFCCCPRETIMISPANGEGCESEHKVLAQVFPTSPAFQREGTNRLRHASRSHRSQCHQRAQKNKGKRARTSHTALPHISPPAPSPGNVNRTGNHPLCGAPCPPPAPRARSVSPAPSGRAAGASVRSQHLLLTEV